MIIHATRQQREIQKLRSRLAALEKGPAAGTEREEGRAWYDSSPERLAAWASECRVSADAPTVDRWQPLKSLGKNPRGLEPSELAHYNAAMEEVQQQWKQLVRALYIEATGDVQGADSLSLEAMRGEIEEKGSNEQSSALLQQIARERAGLAQPPADLSKASPYERLFRASLQLGDQTEQALAKRVGAERAKAIRGDGWDSRSQWAGCPD